jgi:hypothetical protein
VKHAFTSSLVKLVAIIAVAVPLAAFLGSSYG